MKEKASNIYSLASLIGMNIANLLSKNAKVPNIEEIYPTLFGEEKEEVLEEGQLSLAEAQFVAGMLNNFNVKIK